VNVTDIMERKIGLNQQKYKPDDISIKKTEEDLIYIIKQKHP